MVREEQSEVDEGREEEDRNQRFLVARDRDAESEQARDNGGAEPSEEESGERPV